MNRLEGTRKRELGAYGTSYSFKKMKFCKQGQHYKLIMSELPIEGDQY